MNGSSIVDLLVSRRRAAMLCRFTGAWASTARWAHHRNPWVELFNAAPETSFSTSRTWARWHPMIADVA
jgi:hypothetical protein